MRRIRTSAVIAALGASMVIGATGCREEGPAERAGREVDEAMESAREGLEDVAEEGPMERAGEKMDDAIDDAADRLEEAEQELSD